MSFEEDSRKPPDLATQFRRILSISKEKRTSEDADIIYGHLREIQALSKLPESIIHQMAKHSWYEVHEANEPNLYCAGDLASCCYILLAGSVYLNGYLYLPGSCFGQQTDSGTRVSDCLILEHSEMIVISYPRKEIESSVVNDTHFKDLTDCDALIIKKSNVKKGSENVKANQQCYINSSISNSSLDRIEWDLSGIQMKDNIDLSIDSDEDDDMGESGVVQDIVRDCLEKEPSERTENDVNILMDFIQHLPAFSKLSHNIKIEMCKVMVFAVVSEAGAVVMEDHEKMDSWSVILNGSVEILQKSKPPKVLTLGDSFGVNPTPGIMYHDGTMKTRVPDCQFVCIAEDDYWRIFSQGEASCRKVEEEGEVVMVTEHRVTDGGSRQGQVVIKGTPERLLDHLMEDHSVIDPTYVEDFLLTYVVFFNKAHDLIKKLIKWFDRPQLQGKVTRVMLLWVNNHYCDFEGDSLMESALERFENLLELKKMLGQLRLLNMACSAKSKPRIITIERISKDSKLDFSICGGRDRGYPIFISQVNYDSRAYSLGLKRGDQILQCNGTSFEHITGQKAIDLLTYHTHLSLIVKSNSIGFKETSQLPRKTRGNTSLDETTLSNQLNALDLKKGTSVSRSASDVHQGGIANALKRGCNYLSEIEYYGHMTVPRSNKLNKLKMKLKLPRVASDKDIPKVDQQNEGQHLNRYFTRPGSDGSNEQRMLHSSEDAIDLNVQVIKVYRGDHTSRFFVLTKDTIAKEVIATAITAFGISDNKSFFLCEVTVTEDGLIRQKRLADVANNLANRINLNGRYYIKSSISEGPLSDEVAQEISREASLTLLQFEPLDIAKELTLQDFELFRSVDSREYIYNLFEEKNERKSKNLRRVEQTTNTEMFWVISEICSEHNITKRVKLLKYFIKVAKYCKDFKNYNSMYALVSGLANSAVSRLKNTWEKLPQKSENLFNDLQDLMDPSRNMSKYRNLFTGERCYPPLIPWFPIVKKDVTFLHLGNDTIVDGLVNFEKLRMISREVRKICKYCNIGYDPYKMDVLDGNEGDASVALSVVSLSSKTANRRSGRGTSTMNNPKKAYEEFQISRRIQQYLERLFLRQYSEKELQEMSYNCEPPTSIPTHALKKPSPVLHRNKEQTKCKETDSSHSMGNREQQTARIVTNSSLPTWQRNINLADSAGEFASGMEKFKSVSDQQVNNGSAKQFRHEQRKKHRNQPFLNKEGADPKSLLDDDLHGQVSMV